MDFETEPALGTVVDLDRGSLPFELLHGEALVACAAWALGEAGVTPVDFSTPWAEIVESGQPFVLHDSLCPMVPADFIAACVARATSQDSVVLGVRAVTDTVKVCREKEVSETIDRDGLRTVTSPIVVPSRVAAQWDGVPTWDFVELVEDLVASGESVIQCEAPSAGWRVAGPADVTMLAEMTDPAR